MLEAKNLVKIYSPKKGSPVTALNNVSVSFAEKGLVFLLGKSGSGKSTLLNLLGGLDSISSGEIIIKGKSSDTFKQSDFDSYRNTFIGFIFQEFYIIEDYSVGHNIGLAMELQNKKSDPQIINRILAQVDLEGYSNRKPTELSGGQKQRVAIARALIKNPEIIMADEPTGSLDSKTGKQVLETLKKLASEKLVIIVSHDNESAETFADRIIELADGVIISDRIRNTEGNLIQQPINYLSNKLVQIKAGHTLTVDDVDKINKMLKNSNCDTYISLDENSNKEFSNKALSSGGGFIHTTKENISLKKYNEAEFKLVKSRLPFKDSLKMGASGLKLKKIRLAFTIILSFLAFTLFGISNTVAAFDPYKTELQTMYDNDVTMLTLKAQSGYTSSSGKTYYEDWDTSTKLTDDHLDKLFKLTGSPVLKAVEEAGGYYGNDSKVNIKKHLNEVPTSDYAYYSFQSISKLIEVPSLESANLKVLAGKLPVELNNYDEIGISDYVADIFIKYGFKQHDEETGKSVGGYNDLLGKKLSVSHNGYLINLSISGVFKTEFNTARWEKYKTMLKNELSFFEKNTFSSLNNMLLCMGYVKPGFSLEIEKLIDANNKKNGVYIGNASLEFESIGGAIYYAYPYDKTSNQYFGSEIAAPTSLKDNEIIVPAVFLQKREIADLKAEFDRLLNENFLEAKISIYSIETTVKIIGISFVEEYSYGIFTSENLIDKLEKDYNDTREKSYNDFDYVYLDYYGFGNFDSNALFSSSSSSMAKYDQELASEVFPNIYWGEGKTARPLASDEVIISAHFFRDSYSSDSVALSEIQIKALFDNMLLSGKLNAKIGRITHHSNKSYLSEVNNLEMKIAAVNFNGISLLSSELFARVKAISKMPQTVIIKLTGIWDKDIEIMNYLKNSEVFGKDTAFRIIMKTTLSSILETVDQMIVGLRRVFFWGSIVFSAFAGLLLMNFIGVSVNAKKKEIGILRAIGARSSDVFKIFFNEGVVIGIINSVLSITAVIVISLVVNSLLGIGLLLPGILQVGLILLLCFSVVFLATLVPVRKIAMKKPIDAINNR